MKKIIFLILFVILSYFFFHQKEVKQPPGVLISDAPSQEPLREKIVKENKDYIVSAVASYEITARVLAKKEYSDRQSEVAPLDLALGWQKMSSNELLKTLKISQSNRFYFWHTNESDYPRHEIETQSANTHIIPANKYVESQLKKVELGTVVHMKGYLVNAKSKKDKFTWISSTRRDDTGNGACELMYVESMEIN